MSWKVALVGVGVAAVLGATFVLPGLLDGSNHGSEAAHARSLGVGVGTGLPTGSAVPAFSERNLLTGKAITAKSVYRQRTLLFFSEGVMCQACFQQIQSLQQVEASLHQRGIQLVSITPDSPVELEQAAQQYGITTPLISDQDLTMSNAFNTLGQGMHASTPGHAFALIDKGKVLWYRDYWLAPDRTMYVPTSRLLADMPRV